MSLTAVFILVLAAVLAWLIWRWTFGAAAMERNRARAMKWRIQMYRRPGPGWASAAELAVRWSRIAAVRHGKRARPGLSRWERITGPATLYAVYLGRSMLGKRVWGRMEDNTLCVAPPRMGKTGALVTRIAAHPGPVVTTTTRTDVVDHTAPYRAKLGPLWIFNPMGVGDLPSNMEWEFLEGCEDPQMALLRAEDMTGWVKDGSDMKVWQRLAAVSMASLLFAAARTPGGTMTLVYAWISRFQEKLAEAALEADHLTGGVFQSAYEQIRRNGKTADSIRTIMSESLTWIASPAAQQAVARGGQSPFRVRDFIEKRGTLYLIAPGGEESTIAPLMRALVSHIHRTTALMGSRSRVKRQDPPLYEALDEVTQVCPVPLARWLADSAGKGILITAVVHGYAQMEAQWGRFDAATIWDTTGTKVFLGGIQNNDTLEDVSKLCGEVTIRHGDEKTSKERVLPPELLRMLPDWWGMVLRTNRPPAAVRLPMIWDQRGYKRAQREWEHARHWHFPWPVPVSLPEKIPAVHIPAPPAAPALNGHGARQRDAEES